MASGKGHFDVDTENWQAGGAPSTMVQATVDGVTALKVTYVYWAAHTISARAFLDNDNGDLSENLTVGNTYCIKIRYKTDGKFKFYTYQGFGNTTYLSAEFTDTDWTWYEIEFVAEAATGATFNIQDSDVGDNIWIDQWIMSTPDVQDEVLTATIEQDEVTAVIAR